MLMAPEDARPVKLPGNARKRCSYPSRKPPLAEPARTGPCPLEIRTVYSLARQGHIFYKTSAPEKGRRAEAAENG